jgi:hypothetical protein
MAVKGFIGLALGYAPALLLNIRQGLKWLASKNN